MAMSHADADFKSIRRKCKICGRPLSNLQRHEGSLVCSEQCQQIFINKGFNLIFLPLKLLFIGIGKLYHLNFKWLFKKNPNDKILIIVIKKIFSAIFWLINLMILIIVILCIFALATL